MVTYSLYRRSRFWNPVTQDCDQTLIKECKTLEEARELKKQQHHSVQRFLVILPTGEDESMARRIAES